MSQSDGEGSGVETGTDRFVNATTETEVELHLPLEVDQTGFARTSRFTWELTTWTLSVLIWKRSADLDPPNGAKPKTRGAVTLRSGTP